MSPLCETCQAQAKRTGHAGGPSLRFASTEVREEVVEPSGPFLLPHALPPDDVLEHLDARRPTTPDDQVVIEPSGPFVLPGAPEIPEAAMLHAGSPPPPPARPQPPPTPAPEEDVVEPSGPFLVPASGSGGVEAPVSLEQPGGTADPYLHPGRSVVLGGVARSAPKAVHPIDPSAPSVVVDASVGRRAEATVELAGRQGTAPSIETGAGQASWTPLAIAFAAGMLAGAALTIAILRL